MKFSIFSFIFVLTLNKLSLAQSYIYSNSLTSNSDHYVTTATYNQSNKLLATSYDFNSQKGYIIKLDTSGSVLQEQQFNAPSTVLGQATYTADGGFVTTRSVPGGNAVISRFSPAGFHQWSKSYSKAGDSFIDDKVGITYTQNTLGLDEYYLYSSFGSENFPTILKLNQDGNLIWNSTLTGLAIPNTVVTDLIKTSDNNIVLLMQSDVYSYVTKISSFSGSVIRTYYTELKLNSIIEATNGELYVGGSVVTNGNDKDAVVLNLQLSNLDLIQSVYFGNNLDQSVCSIIEKSDGSFLLGTDEEVGSNSDIGIYKLTPNLQLEWAKSYGGFEDEEFVSFFEKPSGSISIIGSSKSFSGGWSLFYNEINNDGDGAGCQNNLNSITSTTNSFSYSLCGNGNPSDVFNQIIYSITLNTSSTINPIQPTFQINGSVNPPNCFGGLGGVDIVPTGGSLPFSYLWSTGTIAQNLTNQGQGIYSVSVTDANGCTMKDTFELIAPSEVIVTSITTDVSCFGQQNGSIDLTITGGTPSYNVNWTYQGLNTEDLLNIPGGFYQATITDNSGCQKVHSVSIAEPTPLVAIIASSTEPSCFDNCDGQIAVNVTGGTAPYQYIWNNSSIGNTANASSLCDGLYTVQVTDEHSCSAIAGLQLFQPQELSVNVQTTNSVCGSHIGTASASILGGTVPYSYDWNVNTNLSFIDSLSSGNYSLMVTDAHGCNQNQTFTIDDSLAPISICVVTVNSGKNEIVWEKPVADNIIGFTIYRNIAGTYVPVGFQPYDSLSRYIDTDFGVDPSVTSYRYKISAVDSCGNESALSGYHETIHLTSNSGISGEVNLIWDSYEGLGFNEYQIWRDTIGDGSFEFLSSVTNNNFTYTDFSLPSTVTTAKYQVRIEILSPCTATIKAQDYNSSRSNNSSIIQDNGLSLTETNLAAISIFPNPAADAVNISVPYPLWSYTLFDISGKEIIPQIEVATEKTTLSLNDLMRGIYFVRIEINNTSITRKLILQ